MELFLAKNLNFSLLAFIPALLNIGVIFYILFRLPKSRIIDVFTCFVFALVLWQLEDAIFRLSPSVEVARFWDSILCIGWLAAGPLAFHFASRYASLKKLYTRTGLFLVYMPFVFFYVTYIANLPNAVYTRNDDWGWIHQPHPGTLEEIRRYWILVMLTITVIILLRHSFSIRTNKNKITQARIIVAGILVTALLHMITKVILPLFLSVNEIPVTSACMSVFSIATIIALSKYKMFLVSESVQSDNLLENLNKIVLIISPEKKIIYLNRYASGVLGISQADREIISFENIFPPLEDGFRKYSGDVFNKVLKGQVIDNYSSSFVTCENKKINVIMTSSLIVNNNIRQGVLILANDITQTVTALKDLEMERLRREKEIAEAGIVAQENERKTIGGELHDNVNQILVSSLLYLNMVKKESKNELPFLEEVAGLVTKAIDEIRKLSHTLIAPSLNESELSLAFDNIIAIAGKTGTLTIEKEMSGINEKIIPDNLKLNIYRIVQEQFNNIIKYARAKTVCLKLIQQEDKLLLDIKDDGIGFDTSKKSWGRGIMNMKNRASLNNGEMKIISSPGKGCELYVAFKNFAW